MLKLTLVGNTLLLSALSASAQEMAPVKYNGSLAIFTRDANRHVEIRYDTPKAGLPVEKGMVIFEGVYDGRGSYFGTAYIFKAGCEPAPYHVSGRDQDGDIVLAGIAPHRDLRSCAVVGEQPSGKNSRLVSEFEPD